MYYVASPPLLTKGASAIHIFKMCNAFSKLGCEVTLLIPPYDKNVDTFKYYNVEQNFKIRSLLSTKNKLRQIIHGITSAMFLINKKKDIDIIITRNIIFAFLSTLFFKIPTIYDAHHPPVNMAAQLMLYLFKDSDYLVKITTNSQGLAKIYLKNKVSSYKLKVAHNGVDLDNLKVIPKNKARKITNLPINRKIAVYSGNIYRGRGIELLIEIAPHLKNIQFVIVGGDSDEVEHYIKIVEEKRLNNFLFKGFVNQSQVFNYLLSADILILPYTSNITIKSGTVASEFTSPIKLFEYMASNRVVVASGIPAVLEILKHGVNAYIVKPDDLESLKNGIEFVFNNVVSSRKYASQALKDVTNYTWQKRAERILDHM